ncbi:MAG TPA: DUF4233 domain-containing protein [Mycobacteriales bacterium]|nr:DUF4233 domain-containing protein [Mycobacteriales bacterium]
MTDERPAAPRGLYAIGTAGLTIEALVVLLAIPAVATAQRGHVSGLDLGLLGGLFGLLVVSAGVLRRPGGKVVSSLAQVAAIATGVISWPMYVVGVAFAGIWVYWLRQWHLPHPSSPT